MTKISRNKAVRHQALAHTGAITWRTRLGRAGVFLLKVVGLTVGVISLSVGAVFLLIYWLTYQETNYAPGAAELDPHIEEYTSNTGLKDVSDETVPYRVGKLVAVDVRNHKLDRRLQKALPADLRAARHVEVGTVVWVSCGEDQVGIYRSYEGIGGEQGRAYQGFCEITVIDRAAALIVEKQRFVADRPPSTTTRKGDIHTEVEVDRILQFLLGLPDKLTLETGPLTVPTFVPGSMMTIMPAGILQAGDKSRFRPASPGQSSSFPHSNTFSASGIVNPLHSGTRDGSLRSTL
jgi:hypothetical protein